MMEIDTKKANRSILFSAIAAVILVMLFMSLTSCFGTRTVNKKNVSEAASLEQSQKVSEKSKEDTNLKVTQTVTETDNGKTVTVEEVWEPCDPTKTAVYTDEKGNRKELNNSKKTTKTTSVSSNYKKDLKTDTSLQDSKESDNQKDLFTKSGYKHDEDVKAVENEKIIPWWLIALFVGGLACLVIAKRVTLFS